MPPGHEGTLGQADGSKMAAEEEADEGAWWAESLGEEMLKQHEVWWCGQYAIICSPDTSVWLYNTQHKQISETDTEKQFNA